MTRSPKRLNSTQYNENCQNRSVKIDFQKPCYAIDPEFGKNNKIVEISVSNCIGKKRERRFEPIFC